MNGQPQSESPGEIEREPQGSIPQAGDDTCMHCGELMVTEYYMNLQDDTGQIGITGFRCTSCGEVIAWSFFRTD